MFEEDAVAQMEDLGHHFFVFVNAAFVSKAAAWFGELLVNFQFVAGLRLSGDGVHDV